MSETNKYLREIARNTKPDCCFNNIDQIEIENGALVDEKIFEVGTVHSIAWLTQTGATVDISIDGGSAITYSSAGTMTFDTVNKNQIIFSATAGIIAIQWIY